MKPIRNLAKCAGLALAAMPIGAVLGFLCAALILLVNQIFGWLV